MQWEEKELLNVIVILFSLLFVRRSRYRSSMSLSMKIISMQLEKPKNEKKKWKKVIKTTWEQITSHK